MPRAVEPGRYLRASSVLHECVATKLTADARRLPQLEVLIIITQDEPPAPRHFSVCGSSSPTMSCEPFAGAVGTEDRR